MKPLHKRLATISEALQIFGEATSNQIATKTNMKRLTVQQGLAELKRRGCVTRGDHTGTGNEVIWFHIKPFVVKSKTQMDFTEHYQIFRNMINGQVQTSV